MVPTGESVQSSVVPTPNCEHLGTPQFPQPWSEKLLVQGTTEDAERHIWSKSWESVIASTHQDICTLKCLSFLGHVPCVDYCLGKMHITKFAYLCLHLLSKPVGGLVRSEQIYFSAHTSDIPEA